MAEMSSYLNRKFNFEDDSPVQCMLCDMLFTVSNDIQQFLHHLLDAHNFLIEAPLEILDIKEYILYWKKLKCAKLQDYCIVYITNAEPDSNSPQTTYYLLSQRLPEDQELRSTIREEKLKYISNQMRAEWQDKNYSRKCVYCANVIEGGLHKVFDHIKYDHNISLGSNIVFGAKLLDIIEDKLQKLLCLFCENQFKNHVSLREHMRKKHHKSLNPKNKIYDKFYLVNYIKAGTSWEEAKQELLDELDEDEIDKEQGDEQMQWEDWDVGESNETCETCLFCTFATSKIPSDLYSHMEVEHRYNFEEHTANMSFYGKVKLVNYIRTKIFDNTCSSCNCMLSTREELLRHMKKHNHFVTKHNLWDDIRYFIPFLKNDGLLHSMKDNDTLDENSSGYESSNPDEIVFPETIPRHFQTVETSENNAAESTEQQTEKAYKCLFCSYVIKGVESKTICTSHMECNHCFSYKDSVKSFHSSEAIKLINYIRFMTDRHQCFACHKKLNSESALVVHLQLCDRLKNSDQFDNLDDRWETSYLSNDNFILDLEQRMDRFTVSTEASST